MREDSERKRVCPWPDCGATFILEPAAPANKLYCSSRCGRRHRFEKDPSTFRNASRRWRERHPAEQKARLSAYRLANMSKDAARSLTRYHRASSVDVRVVTERDLARIMAGPCPCCGAVAGLTLEHITPLSRGGRHAIGNLEAVCTAYNSSKKDLLLAEVLYSPRHAGRLAARRRKSARQRPT